MRSRQEVDHNVVHAMCTSSRLPAHKGAAGAIAYSKAKEVFELQTCDHVTSMVPTTQLVGVRAVRASLVCCASGETMHMAICFVVSRRWAKHYAQHSFGVSEVGQDTACGK